ncbi:hypothetical protein [Hyphomicrobium sp.]|uniref:bestrophin-like domain n=1 Tax=Hyphomicrobium sp. TaxID=82 RepID=UPI002E350F9B|nr:hypothetical protein [Hyphomicrobium sp.]HEX2843191.1 hypothetical protein [Hyphomicrobium sp.]
MLVAAALIAGLMAAHELGFRLGSSTRSADQILDRQVTLVRASTAALVAFLIGFTFSGAASRFIDRLDIIVKESNAVGTAYLRADVIAEPYRSELKDAIREYTRDRIKLLGGADHPQIDSLLAKVSGLHDRMWQSAIEATRDNAPLMAVVLPPINDVIDLHATHLAMARRHLPLPILAALLGTIAIGVGLLGFGNGRVNRRFSLLDSVYGVVLAIALWMTIDLDHPGMGMLRVNGSSFEAALAAMR